MLYATMDFVACPTCKHFPLSLHVVKEIKRKTIAKEKIEIPLCKTFCGYRKEYITKGNGLVNVNCIECLSKDIAWGALCCPRCKRVYPIILGIPLMYPNYLQHNPKILTLYRTFVNKLKISIEC